MNDRIFFSGNEGKLPKPEISIIRDGESIYKPGMKTFFVGSRDGEEAERNDEVHGRDAHVVGGMVCTCDTVSVPANDSSSSSGSSGSSSSNKKRSSSGGSYGGRVCSCVPVH